MWMAYGPSTTGRQIQTNMPRVAFLHPDLGIGGAERLVVDAALSLKQQGYSVCFFTSHHDPSHCFRETADGTLPVQVYGDFLPRSICGRFAAACAYFRSLYTALWLLLTTLLSDDPFDAIIVDSISISIPLLCLFGRHRVLFYCHFPDKLLTQRASLLKRLYRAPLDWIEQFTTGCAHTLFVNSQFTADTFRRAFPSLAHRELLVLHPSINFSKYTEVTAVSESVPQIVFDTLNPVKTRRALFVSINRFERKKNIGLAIHALSLLPRGAAQLVIAGGYDSRVAENVEHYAELVALAAELGLTVSNYPICDAEVVFLRSFDDVQRNFLLTRATAVVYTPENEHFGIVPVEAMYMRRPVIACASGGPIETVGTDRQRGFLCTSEGDFAAAMRELVDDRQGAKALAMGQRAREAMLSLFAFDAFAAKLNAAVIAQLDERRRQSASGAWRMLLNLVVGTMLSWALAGWLCKCGARSS